MTLARTYPQGIHIDELTREIAPPTSARLSVRARIAILTVGVLAAVGAISLFALFASGSPATPSVPQAQPAVAADPEAAAFRYSDDPGGVYDRAVTTPTPSPTPSPTPITPPGPPLKSQSFQMVIDNIGVNAPVNTYGLDYTGAPIVPLNGYEVAWYDWSAQPGTGSNAVFAGHVTWSGPAVFYHLNRVAIGSPVRLVGADGTELTYTVQESFLVDPNDHNALSVMGPVPEDVITIITCDGSFFYTGDPVFNGDYTNRRVIRASLTSIAILPAPLG